MLRKPDTSISYECGLGGSCLGSVVREEGERRRPVRCSWLLVISWSLRLTFIIDSQFRLV